MKGTTHLAIGCAIGAVACAYYPFSLNHAAWYLSVAGFSALSADLDGPSLLSGKITKLSKVLRNVVLGSGIVLMVGLASLYLMFDRFYTGYASCAIAAFLLGLVAKQGFIRNGLVSLVGCVLLYYGLESGQSWMIGLALFIIGAPWLKHRGMTHTVWALALWGAIGRELERQLGIEGIAAVAVAGYASHLLADTMTPSGVKWLYPLYKKSIKLH
jgi:inner membrane protein